MWAIQTPQVFRRGALEAALAEPEDILAQATDDAWLIERAGGTVRVLPSEQPNVKPEDIVSVGQEVKAIIKKFSPKEHKISLSLRGTDVSDLLPGG